jgi:hypothetical protein
MSRRGRTLGENLSLDSRPFPDAVETEMHYQDDIWGFAVSRDLTISDWIVILGEEFGEVAKARIETFGRPSDGALLTMRHELIQVAAVAGQIVDCIDESLGRPSRLDKREGSWDVRNR